MDVETLKRILQLCRNDQVEDSSLRREELIKRFRFHDLVELDSSNQEAVQLATKILCHFIRCDEVLKNKTYLEFSLDFVLCHLSFLVKQKQNSVTLLDLLFVLQQILLGLSNCQFSISAELICEIIESVLCAAHDPNRGAVTRCCCEIMLTILNGDELELTDEAVTNVPRCVDALIDLIEDDPVVGLQITNAVIRHRSKSSLFRNIQSFYCFVIRTLQKINRQTDVETIKLFLSTILNLLKVPTDEVALLESLTVELIKQFGFFCYCSSVVELKLTSVDVLIYMLKYIFVDFPENSTKLFKDLDELTKSSDPRYCDNDLIFIIKYVELVYLNYKHNDDQTAFMIIRKAKNLSVTNRAMLKSLLLLYAAYAAKIKTEDNRNLGSHLLRILHTHPEWEHLVTFHVSQLIWILCKGALPLKTKILYLYLKCHPNDEDLIGCVEMCGAIKLLLNVYLECGECRERTLNLITRMKIPHVMSVLPESILRANQSPELLKWIFGNKPEVPKSDQKGELLVMQLSFLLPNLNDFELIENILTFNLRVVHAHRSYPNVIKPFLISEVIEFLLKLAERRENAALVATRLLILVLRIQECHNVNCQKSVRTDFGALFVNSHSGKTKYLLSLIRSTISTKVQIPILQLITPSLTLLRQLLSLSRSSFRAGSYALAKTLLRTQSNLACSITNGLAIKVECKRKKDNCPEFLAYLLKWLRIVDGRNYVDVPALEIEKYLSGLGDEHKETVRVISNVLNKWQK